MSAPSDRQAARAAVAAYHEAELAVSVQRVGTAIDRFRDGEFEAFDVDRVLFQYSRGEVSSHGCGHPGGRHLHKRRPAASRGHPNNGWVNDAAASFTQP